MSNFHYQKFIADLTEAYTVADENPELSMHSKTKPTSEEISLTKQYSAGTSANATPKLEDIIQNLDKLGDLNHVILALIQSFSYDHTINAIETALDNKEQEQLNSRHQNSPTSSSARKWDNWINEINSTFNNKNIRHESDSNSIDKMTHPEKSENLINDTEPDENNTISKFISQLESAGVQRSSNSPDVNVFVLAENQNKAKILEQILDNQLIICTFKSKGKLTDKTVNDLFEKYSVIVTTPAVLQNLLIADSSKLSTVNLVLSTCFESITRPLISKVKLLISNLPENGRPNIVELDMSSEFMRIERGSGEEKVTERQEYYCKQTKYYPVSRNDEVKENPNVTVTTTIVKKTSSTQDQVIVNKEEIKLNKSVQILNYEISQFDFEFSQKLTDITSSAIQDIQNIPIFKKNQKINNFEELGNWSEEVVAAADQQNPKLSTDEMSILNTILNLMKFTYMLSEMVKEIGTRISKYYISQYVIKMTKEIKAILKNTTETANFSPKREISVFLNIYRAMCTGIIKLVPEMKNMSRESAEDIFKFSPDSNRILKLIELINQFKKKPKLRIVVLIKKIENIPIIKKILSNTNLTTWIEIFQYIENTYKKQIIGEIRMTNEELNMSMLNYNKSQCSVMLINVLKCPLGFLKNVNNFDILVKYGEELEDVSDFETFAKYKKIFKI